MLTPETDFEREIVSEFKCKTISAQVVGNVVEVIGTTKQVNLAEKSKGLDEAVF